MNTPDTQRAREVARELVTAGLEAGLGDGELLEVATGSLGREFQALVELDPERVLLFAAEIAAHLGALVVAQIRSTAEVFGADPRALWTSYLSRATQDPAPPGASD